MSMMNELEMKAQMKMQFQMIKGCFTDCVQSFRESELSASEKSCLQNCAMREIQTFQTMSNLQ